MHLAERKCIATRNAGAFLAATPREVRFRGDQKSEVGVKFKMLDGLISSIKAEMAFKIKRNSGKEMDLMKEIGGTAAHDRTYITLAQDIDDSKFKLRSLVSDSLTIAKITAASRGVPSP